MGYREQSLPPPKREITLDGYTYDIDRFGMDDGRSDEPEAAFRFLFQVGAALLTRVYVIQVGAQQGPPGFYHSIWERDCAAASYLEPEESGPPASVHADPCELPLLYAAVTVLGQHPRHFVLESQRFSAATAEELRMDFALSGGAHLEWTRHDGWRLTEQQHTRPLAPDERLLFGEFPQPAPCTARAPLTRCSCSSKSG